MVLCEKIEYLMKSNNIPNTHQLSILTDIPYTTLKSILSNNTTDIKISTAKKLCNYFKLTFDELLNDDVNLPERNQ